MFALWATPGRANVNEFWLGGVLFGTGIAGSALCSGLETGFYCISGVRLRLRVGAEPPEPAALRVQRELAKPDRLLATLLIWNNIFNYVASFGLTTLMLGMGLSEAWVIALQALILTPLLLVLAESLPKELFRLRADVLPYRLSVLVSLLRFFAAPILPLVLGCARLVARATGDGGGSMRQRRELVTTLLKESALHGAISSVQATLIDRCVDIARTPLGELASPIAGDLLNPGDDRAVRAAVARRAPEPVVVLAARGVVAGIIDPVSSESGPFSLQPPLRIGAASTAREALVLMSGAGMRLAVVVENGLDVGVVTARQLANPLLQALREAGAKE